MIKTTKTIEVFAPIKSVYNQWTQFEEFPHFMEGVKEVRQLSDTELFWRANIDGREKTWTAVITEQQPDKVIAWRSTSGAQNDGRVTFQELDAVTTRLTLQLDYEPEGFIETIGDMIGLVSIRISEDLARFRDYIEAQGHESGAWRGTIEKEREVGGS